MTEPSETTASPMWDVISWGYVWSGRDDDDGRCPRCGASVHPSMFFTHILFHRRIGD